MTNAKEPVGYVPVQRLQALHATLAREPLATGEPAESVQLGRLQVADELAALIREHQAAEPGRAREPIAYKSHAVHTETLHHYRCGHCQSWWSIGDGPPRAQGLYCPFCGTQCP